eukprot:CAMPEP_0202078136 /NCGR_PEP_ID=MMETSP0964-20121228/5761_1 /ASSEMBLY_ACC=CAM_ASM_000500 /TAXON_ID=4773 /ORGANISM="Schizochytrium aggregatum, Strain ATCC28209" /LENGTH=189 /DNA_ID=CAMNT_0048645433 /DNA_START=79 /DNA_END=648 /DNA_ORIENTATION=+
MVIGLLIGVMVVIMRRKFGPVEALSVIIFLGMAVDPSLHLAHTFQYNNGGSESTVVRMQRALTQTGPSVVLAAMTTVGASLMLVATDIVLFTDFGVIVAINTIISIVVAVFFLVPALVVFFDLWYRAKEWWLSTAAGTRAAEGWASLMDRLPTRGAGPRAEQRRSFSSDESTGSQPSHAGGPDHIVHML